ncbi:MAG TPA: carboxymuconolactone decarboxylase family protein [Acetobacteraceae bacterium]|nr:carboxymuconolactone decarboxylase family protein [Acetobacteraceae bacterium]
MMDWNAYRDQLIATTKHLAELNPDMMAGYRAMGQLAVKPGKLDRKTHELIAMAVAITLRCDGCISAHVAGAKKAGATEEEMAEALGVAAMVNTGAAMVYSARALDAAANLSSSVSVKGT